MKAIIFGANGQDGYYLDLLLASGNITSIRVSRSGDHLRGDVADFAFVEALIKEQQPDFIFHLAANSTTAHDVWLENHKTICDGTLYILESVRMHSPHSKVFVSGSGLQFENNGLPISETAPFCATSPYAVSRIHSVYAARYYRSLGIKAYVGYLFNHESPRRSERHMSMKIAAFASRVAAGSREQLAIGDLDVEKEWAFAGDIVRGIWTLVNQEQVFECTIGSGQAYSIRHWLDACFSLTGQEWEPHVSRREGFRAEYSRLVSDPSTIRALGWTPELDFVGLAKLMMGR